MNSPLSKASIKKFIKKNNIDMTEYEEKSYRSYNDFFTRAIKEGARPIPEDPKVLMAPCDSKVSYYKIEDDTKITIKHTVYKLEDLLKSPRLADEYKGGTCLVFRLTVDDYHHYHYVCYSLSGSRIKSPYVIFWLIVFCTHSASQFAFIILQFPKPEIISPQVINIIFF